MVAPRRLEGSFDPDAAPIQLPADEIALRVFGCAVLLGCSALCSGLTLGVMGLDVNQLEILRLSGKPKERIWAERILDVRRDGNLLLCTLLWANMSVNSLLSIIIADLTSGLVGFVVSTVLIVVLGEIIPQAACQRHGLRIGAFFVPAVRFLTMLFYPFAKPIALALDRALGAEIGTLYSREEFQSLLAQHVASNLLHPTEAAIMSGALTFKDTLVRDVATPAARMFSLRSGDVLDGATMGAIYRAGYSRIPVWSADRTAIVGLLYAKDLMLLDARARIPVIAAVHFFKRHGVNIVDDTDTLEEALRVFSSSRQHFAIVRTVDSTGPGDPVYRIGGVVTMEDILEAILKAEIHDEYDALRGDVAGDAAELAASEWHGGASEDGGGGGGGGTSAKALSARLAREEAALRRLKEVFGDVGEEEEGEGGIEGGSAAPAGWGRGVNNRLTNSEVRALAAHLLANVPAFKSPAQSTAASGDVGAPPSGDCIPAGAGGGLTFESVERLVRHCEVVDFTAAPPPPPPGLGRLIRTGQSAANAAVSEGHIGGASGGGGLLADPASYGDDLAEARRVKELVQMPAKHAAAAAASGDVFASAAASSAPQSKLSPLEWAYVRGRPSEHCAVVLEGVLGLTVGVEALEASRGPWQVLGERCLTLADGAYRPDFSARPLTPLVRVLLLHAADFRAARAGEPPHSRHVRATVSALGGSHVALGLAGASAVVTGGGEARVRARPTLETAASALPVAPALESGDAADVTIEVRPAQRALLGAGFVPGKGGGGGAGKAAFTYSYADKAGPASARSDTSDEGPTVPLHTTPAGADAWAAPGQVIGGSAVKKGVKLREDAEAGIELAKTDARLASDGQGDRHAGPRATNLPTSPFNPAVDAFIAAHRESGQPH